MVYFAKSAFYFFSPPDDLLHSYGAACSSDHLLLLCRLPLNTASLQPYDLQPVAPGCVLAGATGAALSQLSSCGGFLLFPEAMPSLRTSALGSGLVCRNCLTAHSWLRCLKFTRAELQAADGTLGMGERIRLLGLGGKSVPARVYLEDELEEGW